MKEDSSRRLAHIDALRGIAIALVFVVHAASRADVSGTLEKVTACGQYGVQLFFVVSAYTIMLSLDRRSGTDPNLFSNFFIRRLFRIVPVYWFGILLYTLLYGLDSRSLLPGPEPWHFLLHVPLLNVLHPATSSSVVPGGWSISLEVLFYLAVPLLLAAITSTKRALMFSALAVVFLPVANLILSRLAGPLIKVDEHILNGLFWYRFPLNQLGAFAMGFLLFYLSKNQVLKDFLSDRLLNLTLLASLLACCVFLTISKIPFPPKHLIYSVLFCGVGLLLGTCPWAFLVNTPLRFLGKISYSCYLLHFLVLKELLVLQERYSLILSDQHVRFLVLLLLTILITVPLSWVSYKLIECPAIGLGRALIKRRSKQTAPAPIEPIPASETKAAAPAKSSAD